MNNTLRVMLKIWGVNTSDWMGYDNLERYSFHHLIKKSDGGKQEINNGAVLHQSSHAYLHTIEYYRYEMYEYINNILKEINNQRYMPTKDQLEKIRNVLLEFEREYTGKVSSRGKDIIKKEYKLTKY